VEGHEGDFAAEGIAARIALSKGGIASAAFEALDRGEITMALDALLTSLTETDEDATREQLRRAVIGILADLDPGDPTAIRYRRRLATALY
jgi:putative thioredoxin